MSTLFLIRHGAHGDLGRVLTGRGAGVGLSPHGRAQAQALGRMLTHLSLDAVETSPRLRARETAEILAAACALPQPAIAPALDEIEFGAWTGRTFAALEEDAGFHAWNEARATARPPGGESMGEAQARIAAHLAARAAAGARLALVSHQDVIKAAVCAVLHLSLDAWWRFDISPCALTTIETWGAGLRVTGLNTQPHLA